MKKILPFLFLALAWSPISAQDDEEEKRPNGIRFGYQHSNLVNDDEDAANNLDRFYLGFVRQVKLGPLFRLETGLEYMMAGAQISDNTKVELNYLVLPAQLKIKIGPFYGLAGLNGNFMIVENLTVSGEDVDVNDENRAAFFDLAADVGIGFNIIFLSIEGRQYWGLINTGAGWYNQYTQVGLKFNF